MVQASVTARVARGWSCCWHECDWRGCAQGWKTCMLGAGPPRDGIIRTSPGQECSKDKGALPGARRIFVYVARFWSTAGRISTMWFKPHRLVLHLNEKRVSLYPAKRQAPVAQWIEHLITVQKVGGSSPFGRAAAPLGAIHRWGFCICGKHSFGSAFFMPDEAPTRPDESDASRASRARRRHHPRLGRQGTQPLNPQGLRDI